MTSYLVLLRLIHKVLLTSELKTDPVTKLQCKMALSLNSELSFLKRKKMIPNPITLIMPGHSKAWYSQSNEFCNASAERRNFLCAKWDILTNGEGEHEEKRNRCICVFY